jgi:predicted membrane channel-forming protein YqfA (hemolysin III family)
MVIAGSYTPVLLIALHHHNSAQVLLTAEWIAAVLGSIVSGKDVSLCFLLLTSDSIL